MAKIKAFITQHPQWTSWIVLSIGMVLILIWSARDVGLLAGQWVALIIATIAVAGLAVWIIGWEDEDEDDEDAGGEKSKTPPPAAPAEPESPSEV